MDQPEWLLDNGERVPLYGVEKTLIPATSVEMVEFLKSSEEIGVGGEEVDAANRLLTQRRTKEEDDGK